MSDALKEPSKLLFGLRDTAELVGLQESTVRRWAWERKIPTVKLGRRVLIRREVIEELIRRNERPAIAERGRSTSW